MLPLAVAPFTRTIELDQPGSVNAPGILHGGFFDPALYIHLVGSSGDRFRIAGYAHRVLDRHGRELLAFHWHPDPAVPAPTFPHVHVSARLVVPNPAGEADSASLDKLHLPTGFVPIPAVVRMLIEEFGARPLTVRWRERLAAAERLLRDDLPSR